MREPVARRGWGLVTRGLRAYLIGVAEDDGTLLKRCADPFELATNLTAHGDELELVRRAIETLLEDGFLRWEGEPGAPGWLGIDRLVTFGPADAGLGWEEPVQHPGESSAERKLRLARERKDRWKARQQNAESVPGSVPSVPQSVPGCVPESVPGTRSGDLSPHSPLSDKQKNKQKNRSEERDARAAGAVPGNAASVPESVPEGVPGNAPDSVPRSVPGTRSGDHERQPARPPVDAGAQGYLRIEPTLDHRKFAEEHNLDLDHYVRRLRRDPRSKNLGTVQAWDVLTKWLQKAARKAAAAPQQLGGAA